MKDKEIIILIVEDEKVDQMALVRFIRDEKLPYTYTMADSVKQAKEMLSSKHFDLILTDYFLGDGTAFDIFEASGNIPKIVVTGTGDEEIAVQAMKKGAYDYIIKDYEGNYLKTIPMTVEKTLQRRYEEQLLKEYQGNLEHLVEQRTAALTAEIAKHRKTEAALKESEEKYRTLFESSRDAIMTLAPPKWLFTSANPATVALFKVRDEAEFISFGPWQLSPERQSDGKPSDEKAKEMIETAMRNGSHFFEWTHCHSDGTPFAAEVLLTRMEHKGQALLQATVRDITERRQTEEEQARLMNQLMQAQKMESIGTLASGIAHDFNNVLSSIIGFTELALDDVEKDTILEDHLQEVYTSGKRAKDLVAQILAFARQTEAKLKPIQVDAITKEVLKFLRSSIPTSIEIKQNIESYSPIVGNPTQMHQVLMNLCTNAAHAMEKGGGTLEVNLKDVAIDGGMQWENLNLKSGNYIELKVSDTGTGIAPEIRDSIFEPYFTTKGPGEGTGMGLAVVHGIVESYGGQITVDSSLGEGTVFAIYLPTIKKSSADRIHVPEKFPTGTERILFVDDEATIARMTGQVLERLGYRVTMRTSSTEALELFRIKPNEFDLVITDMTMPNMTGDKLAAALMEIRPDIPIILCTGYSKKISDETASAIGIKAFAYKPMVKAELAKTVRKVLDAGQNKIV